MSAQFQHKKKAKLQQSDQPVLPVGETMTGFAQAVVCLLPCASHARVSIT
jgi:hypothetical protein